MQNQAAEIKLRAERRAGEMLKETEKQQPGDYKRSHDVTVQIPPGPEKDRLHDVTYPPSLDDLGITKMQSHRWQL